jgi:hypothetical protein
MINRKFAACRLAAMAIGPALLAVLGCSDDGLGKRYSVSGTVTFSDGKPVPKARIGFVPKGQGGQGASGEVVDGRFSSMTTINPGDGVLPGEYYVTVTDKVIDSEKANAASEELSKKHGMGKMAMLPPEVLAKANKEAKGSIPPKYEFPGSTPLSAKVENSNKSFEFKLEP